jgi:hypothetical protein
LRQQLAQEMLQLRRQQIDEELRLIKKVAPQAFDGAREVCKHRFNLRNITSLTNYIGEIEAVGDVGARGGAETGAAK